MQHGNEMSIEMIFSNSMSNEIPANTIKSFSQINFKKEGFLVPGVEVKRMNNLLG
jgi:hypothetical protein